LANLEEVSGLKYLTACIKETLRLYPQGFSHPVTALEDTYLDDMFVPKGVCAGKREGGEARDRGEGGKEES
jgi:cytochrome P450